MTATPDAARTAPLATALPPLPPLREQAERLVELGLAERAGLSAAALQAAAEAEVPGALLVAAAERLPASVLAPYLSRAGRPGFVVVDMEDVDSFAPVPQAPVPEADLYLLTGVERGDEMANWSPDEALPAITAAGRTPLTLVEGLHWLVQQPEALERNHCFMTIGSRKVKAGGRLDARTPAVWISNGTGRDGAARRDAPKVGWCWAGNRHPWLGFASAAERQRVP